MTEAAILEKMNGVYEALRPRLPHLRYLFVTYGTAYVYRLATEAYGGAMGQVVSNCHKLPESCFTRERDEPPKPLLALWTPPRRATEVRLSRSGHCPDGEPRASSA